jgi:hypothetical protein
MDAAVTRRGNFAAAETYEHLHAENSPSARRVLNGEAKLMALSGHGCSMTQPWQSAFSRPKRNSKRGELK